MSWKHVRRFLPIIGVGLFVYLLIFRVGITKIFQEIEHVNLYYVAVVFVLVFIFFVTQTAKWWIIARKQKINVSFKEAFKINLVSNFYGFITPSKLGSIIRVDYLKGKGDTGRGLSNFVIDKVLDLSSLFILAISFGFIFYQKIISSTYLFFIIGLFLLMITIAFIFYKKDATKPLLRFVHRVLIPSKMKEKSRELFDSFYKDMPPLGFLFFVFIINLVNWIIDYTSMYFMALALGIDIGFVPFLAILPISTLVAQIPITINGFGTREITMISLFGLFGVPEVKVLSMSILNILATNVIPSLIALPFLFRRERTKGSSLEQKELYSRERTKGSSLEQRELYSKERTKGSSLEQRELYSKERK